MEQDPGTPIPARLRGTPSWLLTHAAMPASRIAADALAATGAHKYHLALLATLEEFGPASQAELGRRTGIDRSDVVAALNTLSEHGFTRREADGQDRRRNVVTLTAAGRGRVEQLAAAADKAQGEIFAPLTKTEITTLSGLLERVVEHHRKV